MMKRSVMLFFVIAMVLVSLPGIAANPSAKYLKELQGERFTRAADGIITDHKTGLQWKEGPDLDITWQETQTWIKNLGNGWRTPTREDLKGIFIAKTNRQSKDTWSDMRPLHLDPAFLQDKGCVWAEWKNPTYAWTFSFRELGPDFCDNLFNARFNYRAYAVRSAPVANSAHPIP
ncbi:MAG: DUF1566 domain-containing protein [Candidatus Ozemobacteraceae bacterium]